MFTKPDSKHMQQNDEALYEHIEGCAKTAHTHSISPDFPVADFTVVSHLKLLRVLNVESIQTKQIIFASGHPLEYLKMHFSFCII